MIVSSTRLVIALFGGGFDPPHVAHQSMPIFLIEHGYADQVWYVPVKHHPFGKVVSSDQNRLDMLNLVITHTLQTHPNLKDKIRVETWELQQEATSYAINTLRAMAKKHPQYKFRWLIGTDNLPKFHLWGKYQEILSDFGVLVYPRTNCPPEPLLQGMEFITDAPAVSISSTDIRQLAQADQPISQFVLSEVQQYISQKKIYHKSV